MDMTFDGLKAFRDQRSLPYDGVRGLGLKADDSDILTLDKCPGQTLLG